MCLLYIFCTVYFHLTYVICRVRSGGSGPRRSLGRSLKCWRMRHKEERQLKEVKDFCGFSRMPGTTLYTECHHTHTLLPCIMLLLWVAVEVFWERPRLAGFDSEAAEPGWTDAGFTIERTASLYRVLCWCWIKFNRIPVWNYLLAIRPSLHSWINLWHIYLPLCIYIWPLISLHIRVR